MGKETEFKTEVRECKQCRAKFLVAGGPGSRGIQGVRKAYTAHGMPTQYCSTLCNKRAVVARATKELEDKDRTIAELSRRPLLGPAQQLQSGALDGIRLELDGIHGELGSVRQAQLEIYGLLVRLAKDVGLVLTPEEEEVLSESQTPRH